MRHLADRVLGSSSLCACIAFLSPAVFAAPSIRCNAVGYETLAPKVAVAQDATAPGATSFEVLDASRKVVFSGKPSASQSVPGWTGMQFQTLDFSAFSDSGLFTLRLQPSAVVSDTFRIGDARLFRTAAKAVVGFFNGMRNTDEGDHAMGYYNQPTRGKHDVYGGWSDATGDQGKYLSHLSYANFMNPQQIPLVVWSLLRSESLAGVRSEGIAFRDEALWGADYLLRVQDPAGYFYINVFNAQWSGARSICAWIGNDTAQGFPTADYQAAWREGGGMSIAALALASRLEEHGDSTSAQYLAGAKRGFAHLNGAKGKWADDGRENLIDHTTALLAAIELSLATSDPVYLQAARERVDSVLSRQQPLGWYYVDTGSRPWFHAVDEGLPLVALARFLAIDSLSPYAPRVRASLASSLAWYKSITDEVPNPFSYPRMFVPAALPALPGVGNVAKGQPASASTVQGAGQEAAKAFDGDAATRWSSSLQDSLGWIAVDLGSKYRIDSVALVWEAAYAKSYTIQTSPDSVNWTTAATDGTTGAGRHTTKLASRPSARYVRFKGVVRSSPSYSYSIYEFEVYGKEDVPDPVVLPGKTAFFMPHQNETRYWWQGENARLGSMATALILAAQAVDPRWRMSASDTVSRIAVGALDWVGGSNPAGTSFIEGFGPRNPVGYSGKTNVVGGICNGITASREDLSTPQFAPDAPTAWTNWRWVEQWLPHDAWYLLGIASVTNAQERELGTGVHRRASAPPRLSVVRDGFRLRVSAPGATSIAIRSLDGRILAQTLGENSDWQTTTNTLVVVDVRGPGWSRSATIPTVR